MLAIGILPIAGGLLGDDVVLAGWGLYAGWQVGGLSGANRSAQGIVLGGATTAIAGVLGDYVSAVGVLRLTAVQH